MSPTIFDVLSISSLFTNPFGFPVLTWQNLQARVQVSPRIITVAVRALQHSEMFGHFASSQTVERPFSRRLLRMSLKSSPCGSFTLSHSGLRWYFSLSKYVTAMVSTYHNQVLFD